MSYVPNSKLAELIKQRLQVLLRVENPLRFLAIQIEDKKTRYPGLEETVLEDLVMQDIITQYKDKALDELWHLYNVGYFYEDTEKFFKQHRSGDSYETYSTVIVNGRYASSFGKRVRAA